MVFSMGRGVTFRPAFCSLKKCPDFKTGGLRRKEISLRLILKILRAGLYSLYLALLTYISIIYTFIYLYLTNIRLLIRLSATRLLLRILIIIYILLLTSYITALIYLGNTCLQVYLMVLTFSPDTSGRRKVAAIYMAFYRVQQP